MPSYTYTAKSHPQKTIQGSIEAESEQEAVNKLSKMGYFPILIRAENIYPDKKNFWHLSKVSNRDIVLFTQQLSNLIESGVNILSGLSIVLAQTPNKYLKSAVNDIISKIKDGKSFSQGLAVYPDLFSNLYVSMVRSGEVGGNLEQTIKRLSDYLEKAEEFKNSLVASLMYPFFVFMVGTLTVIILVGFVIPRLITMFTEMGQALPLPTRILINISGLLQHNWVFIVAFISISVFLFLRWKRTSTGKIIWDSFKLRTPIWGEIILKTEISRLTHTLSLLLSSGIPILYALDISTSSVDNQILKFELQKFKQKISEGSRFSHCLKDSKSFPDFVTNILTVGEESGTLEKSLMRVAEIYETQVDRSLKTLGRILEPLIILVMGLIVGFIVLSMLLPIFQINLIAR
jgi:type II secretory pathway component PulF